MKRKDQLYVTNVPVPEGAAMMTRVLELPPGDPGIGPPSDHYGGRSGTHREAGGRIPVA